MNKPSVFPATLDTLCYELNGIWNVASLIGIAEVADLARETALKQAGLDLTGLPTFGGTTPTATWRSASTQNLEGIYSWDSTRLLIPATEATDAERAPYRNGAWVLVPRPECPSCGRPYSS